MGKIEIYSLIPVSDAEVQSVSLFTAEDDRTIGLSRRSGNGSFGISTAKLEANATAMASDAQTPSWKALTGMVTQYWQDFSPPMISDVCMIE